MKHLLLLTLSFFAIQVMWAQNSKNKSQKINYQVQKNGFYNYTTKLDNGYVILNDGTKINGKITLKGNSYEAIFTVKLITNAGNKYDFYPRSLKEYGLSNTIVNDTPGAFYWVEQDRGMSSFVSGMNTGNKTVSKGREGWANYGYVITKDGKTFEGAVTVKEVAQKIKSITVKTESGKLTFKKEDVSNFGVKAFEDKKFESSLSLFNWNNGKSNAAIGYVKLKDGSIHNGKITLVRSGDVVTKVRITPLGQKKPLKIKYSDIDIYGIQENMTYYKTVLENNQQYSLIHPERKFYKGKVILVDGTVKKGLIAKENKGDISSIFYVENKEAVLQYFSKDKVEFTAQDIPQNDILDWERDTYEDTHVLDYPIDFEGKWKYKSMNEGSSKTEFMWGYLKMKNGDAKVGEISIKTMGAIRTYFLRNGEEEKKYKNEVARCGLLSSREKEKFISTFDEIQIVEKEIIPASVINKINSVSQGSKGTLVFQDGSEQQGLITLKPLPNVTFSEKVIFTNENGESLEYTTADDVMHFKVLIDNEEKMFVNYQNVFVEVLQKEESYVLFKNPFPTTKKTSGEIASLATGVALENLDEALRNAGGAVTKNNSLENIDWTKEETIKLYAEEYIMYHLPTRRATMYAPGKNYQQVEADLMGTIEYLSLDKQVQKSLLKVESAAITMAFLNKNMNN